MVFLWFSYLPGLPRGHHGRGPRPLLQGFAEGQGRRAQGSLEFAPKPIGILRKLKSPILGKWWFNGGLMVF